MIAHAKLVKSLFSIGTIDVLNGAAVQHRAVDATLRARQRGAIRATSWVSQHELRLIMKSNIHEQHVPHESEETLPTTGKPGGRAAGTTQPDIADSDKQARTGKADERVRNTPPAGSWNDVASNE